MKKIVLLAAAMLPSSVLAQSYLIENVRLFNGVDPELTAGHVLVADGVIAEVSDDAIAPPDGATVIDGGNRVLSPGFIDLHAHGQNIGDYRMQGPGQEADNDVGRRDGSFQHRGVSGVQRDGPAAGVSGDKDFGRTRVPIGHNHLQALFFQQIADRGTRHRSGSQDQYLFHDASIYKRQND